MADCGHRLVRLHEVPHELDRVSVGAKLVRIGNASRQHQRVEVSRARIGDHAADREPIALLAVIHRLNLTGLVREKCHVSACLLERIPRCGKLDLFHAICGEESDFAPFELSGHGYLRIRYAASSIFNIWVRQCATQRSLPASRIPRPAPCVQ